MEIGDEIHRRLYVVSVWARGERAVTQVLVDVPDGAAAVVCRHPEQTRTAIAQSERRQPTFGDEAAALSDGRLQALDHDRPPRGARLDLQPVDPALELSHDAHPIGGIGALQ